MKLQPRNTQLGQRIVQVLAWPFTNRYAAPIWFTLRLYMGWIFLQFSIQKFRAGWLTSDPVGGLLGHAAAGRIPVPLPFYRDVAAALIDAGATPLISFAMPFAELAVALAMFSGVLLIPAAVGGILLNINILLSGTGSLGLDGRMIAIALLIIVAHHVAGRIGVQPLLELGGRRLAMSQGIGSWRLAGARIPVRRRGKR
jgi:uncharacterized membrane protein YphA (DoxX/SURF4 family)